MDFLIQLDCENLLESLTTKEQQTTKDTIPGKGMNIISDGSFSDLMQRANEKIWRSV